MIMAGSCAHHGDDDQPWFRQDARLFGGARCLAPGASCNYNSCMKRNSQLSGVLHVLLHMAGHDVPITSEVLAGAMRTNPVVVRRILAGLREHGFVRSEKGHGGGWTLVRELSGMTLLDVYAALGCPPLLALANRTETPGCVVEQAVNSALGDAFDEAEALLLTRFGEVTLATLCSSVRGRMRPRGNWGGGGACGMTR